MVQERNPGRLGKRLQCRPVLEVLRFCPGRSWEKHQDSCKKETKKDIHGQNHGYVDLSRKVFVIASTIEREQVQITLSCLSVCFVFIVLLTLNKPF
jgi:hypothetical protein